MHASHRMPSARESDVPALPRRQGLHEQHDEVRNRVQFDPELVGVYSCDAAGVIDYCSDRAVALWGRRPDVGDTDERFCGAHKLYRPDGTYMPNAKCPMADVLSGAVSGVHDAEIHIERPDGPRIIVVVNIAPLLNGDGVIVGAVNSFYDIADRKHVTDQHKKNGAT